LKEKSVSDTDVKMAVHAVDGKERRTPGKVHFQCGGVTIFARLVDGSFPKWRSVIPKTDDRLHAKVNCGTLRTALDRMVTTNLEPGVLFTFRRGNLTLESRAKESGQSKAAIPVAFNDSAEFIIDVTFMRDYLRTLDAETVIDVYMTVTDDPVLFEIDGDSYVYLVMPMSRDKTACAKPATETAEPVSPEPEADTGIEDVDQESTMEEDMRDTDKCPCPDDYADLQTRFFQLQMELDQTQAKAVHYKTLLDRAMMLIERLKNDQRVCV
jgi:hypothetical protein